MNQHNTPRNLRLLSVVALSGALMVSGCTDDSEEANKDDTSTASGATAEDAGVTGACDAYTDITLAMAEAPDGDPTAWFTDTIAPMADDLDAADKPADIEGDLDTMIGTVRQVAQTGDPSAFEEPKFGEAQTKVDRYMFDNCEFDQKLEVSGKDYSFEGLSDELPPDGRRSCSPTTAWRHTRSSSPPRRTGSPRASASCSKCPRRRRWPRSTCWVGRWPPRG